MPHKDRETHLNYIREHHYKHRSPKAKPQQDEDLPPRGEVRFSEDGTRVQCHSCGRWLKSLNTHVKTHGMDMDEYKERYELARTASLWPPALVVKQRELALDRDQGSVGREALAEIGPNPRQPGAKARLQSRIKESDERKGRYFRGKPTDRR